jgi:riboflavin kinase/FMN adenylyltransferase
VPPAGVYATTVNLDGIVYPSITNIGTRPTFEDGVENIVETHIFDFDRDMYGATLRLGFVQRLRDEQKFDGIDALKTQIDADRARAKDLFDRMGL